MEPGFSETSFSHALYGEMLRALPTFRTPYFPSTVEEFWIPYDMEWSLSARRSLFIQFKVSEYLDHPRAAQKTRVACPYYRFRLHHSRGTSTQHNLLKDLSDTFPGDVLYAAPMFYSYQEYNDLYLGRGIANNSVAVDINSMSWFTDSRRHCVAYNLSQIGEFSDWREIGEVTLVAEILDRLRAQIETGPRLGREWQEQTVAHLKKVHESLIETLRKREIAPELLPDRPDYDRPWRPWLSFPEEMGASWDDVSRLMQLAGAVRSIARRYFGAYWIGLA